MISAFLQVPTIWWYLFGWGVGGFLLGAFSLFLFQHYIDSE